MITIQETFFSESAASFDDTQLVSSARAPVHDAAAGIVAPPGQTEVETVRLFSAPLGPRDGGPGPLDSTVRRQNMVDHVTHHEMEQEKRRRHLELQTFSRKQMKEKELAPRTEQEQKSISARSHCISEVGDDPNEHGTETHREKSKVENSAKSDRRRRRRHKSRKTSHHDQNSRSRYRYNRHIQKRRRDSDSHHDDSDTDRYRDRRSSLDRRKPRYELRQRRRHSPSVVRDRYRGKGRRRRSRSHTNSKSWYRLRRADNDVRDRHRCHESPKRNTTTDNANPNSVSPKKGVGVCNLPTGMDSILLPQMTIINTTSVASPNTARTSVTANDCGFTVHIDNDLDIEGVETEDADNDIPTPRDQTSVHIDEVKPQETEPVKLWTSIRTMIGFYTMKTQVLRTQRVLIAFDDDDNEKPPAREMMKQVLQDALEQPLHEPGSVQGHIRTGLLTLHLKTAANIVSVSPDKPTVTIVSDSRKSVDVQCPSLNWTNCHHVSRHTYHRQAATQGDEALTQRSDVSMASTIAMRATEEPSRIPKTFEQYTGNMVITPSVYVAPRCVVISPGSECDSETHTCMLLTDQSLNRSATMIEYCGLVNVDPPQDQINASMQVSCTLHGDMALNNTELGSLIMRHLSVFVV